MDAPISGSIVSQDDLPDELKSSPSQKPVSGSLVSEDDLPDELKTPPAKKPKSGDIVSDDELPDELKAKKPVPGSLVSEEDLPDELKGTNRSDEPKHGSLGEKVLTGLEGTAQGLGGPLATGLELGLSKMGVQGLSAKEQAERREENPWIHGAGQAVGLGAGIFGGTGEMAMIANAAEHLVPAATTALGKIGSAVLKGAIENGLIQGGDEVSKWMLGQGDPEEPVASALTSIGAAGLLGGIGGGVFRGTGEGLKALGNAKAGQYAKDFLAGVGDAANPGKYFQNGVTLPKGAVAGGKFYQTGLQKAIGKAADWGTTVAAGLISGHSGEDFLSGAMRGFGTAASTHGIGPYLDSFFGKALTPAAKKIAGPVVMKALSSGDTIGLYQLLDHANDVSRGAQRINGAIGNLFKLGSQRAVDEIASDRDREKVKEFMENGGVTQQIQNQQYQDQAEQGQAQGEAMFAKGGQVTAPAPQSQDPISTHYPEQAMLLAAAKGRVSNYLNSLRPQKNTQKLPFDGDHKDHMQEKKYNRAIDIAVNPLSIMNKVKDGSITVEEMNHFHQLYPDVYRQVSKKITQKIVDQQVKGERPHYKTRQGLSLFLGAPMDGSFTPASIQAAQGVFASKRAQQQQPGSPKKGTSKLDKIDDQFQTPQQAAAERQTKD